MDLQKLSHEKKVAIEMMHLGGSRFFQWERLYEDAVRKFANQGERALEESTLLTP